MTAQSKDFEITRGDYNSTTSGSSIAIHRFGSDTDDLATIATANYFDDILAKEIAQLSVKKGDMVAVVDSTQDAQLYKFTAVSPNVTIAVL